MIERVNANMKVDGGKEIHHNVRAVTKGEGLGISPEHEPPAILMKQTNKQTKSRESRTRQISTVKVAVSGNPPSPPLSQHKQLILTYSITQNVGLGEG